MEQEKLEVLLGRIPQLKKELSAEQLRALVWQAALRHPGYSQFVAKKDAIKAVGSIPIPKVDVRRPSKSSWPTFQPVENEHVTQLIALHPSLGRVDYSRSHGPDYNFRRAPPYLEPLFDVVPIMLADPLSDPLEIAQMIHDARSVEANYEARFQENHFIIHVMPSLSGSWRAPDFMISHGSIYNGQRRPMLTDTLLRQGFDLSVMIHVQKAITNLYGLASACRNPIGPNGTLRRFPVELHDKILGYIVDNRLPRQMVLLIIKALSLEEIRLQHERSARNLRQSGSMSISRSFLRSSSPPMLQIKSPLLKRTASLRERLTGPSIFSQSSLGRMSPKQPHDAGTATANLDDSGNETASSPTEESDLKQISPAPKPLKRGRSHADKELAFLARLARCWAIYIMDQFDSSLQEFCEPSAFPAIRSTIYAYIEKGVIGPSQPYQATVRVIGELVWSNKANEADFQKLMSALWTMLNSDLEIIIEEHYDSKRRSGSAPSLV